MAQNKKIKVEIDGDSTGLEKSLNTAEKKLDSFGKNIGGGLGGLSRDVGGAFGSMSMGLTGVATGAGLAGTALGGLVLKLNDAVRELNQISKQSGMSVETLQQLQRTFYSTGLSVDKFADINQDSLDKMGDAIANGGTIADDLKSVGLDVNNYIKYMTQKDGGVKAVIQMFYDLKAAGASVAETKFLLESVASDASRMGEVLEQSANANDAWNKIHSETIAITNESARAFEQFDKNLNDFTTTGQSFLYDFITPTIEELNTLYGWFNKDWDKTKLVELMKGGFKNFFFGGDGAIPEFLRDQFDVSATEVTSQARDTLLNSISSLQGDLQAAVDAGKGQEKLQEKQKKREQDEAQKEADKLQKARDAAAAKAAAAQKRAATERLNAQRTLDAAITDMVIGTNERQLAMFDRQQKELVQKIKDSAKTLGLSQGDLNKLLLDQQASAASKRSDMVNQMIGYQDPNQSMKNNIGLLQSGSLNQNQKNYLADQQAQGLGQNANTQRQLDSNTEAMNLELQQNELLLKGHEDFERRKSEITAKYAAQAVQIQQQETMQIMQSMEDSMGQIGQGMAAAFGESSGAAQAFFAVQKGLTISMTIMKIQEALASALALGFPQNIPAYAQIAAMGMSIISTATGAGSGQFHGGVDELPSSYDNKSFLLKAGERVVQPAANQDLIKFLDEQKGNNGSYSGGGEVTIYSPLIVKGNVDDPETWNKMLQKNQNNVAQAVRSSQKRNT
ncbi:hypothetical protein KK713_004234 [Salmonella enterica]|nr:hypothetical protein [Salmonella enterica]